MRTRRLVSLSLLVGLSVLLHYLEGFVPPLLPIPGFRLGLANIITLFALYYYDGKSYLFVTVTKVLLVALISSGFSVQFFMSLSGSLFSAAISLMLFYLVKGSIYSLSSLASLFHTIGQLFAYALFFNTFYIFSYILILGPLSLLTGTVMALICSILIKRIPARFKNEERIRRQ